MRSPMPRKMIIVFLSLFVIAVAAVSLATTLNPTNNANSEENEKIIEAIKQFDRIEGDIESIPVNVLIENAEKGTKYLYDNEQAKQIINEKMANFPKDLTESDKALFTERVNQFIGAQANSFFPEDGYASFGIGEGTLNYNITDVKISGDTATVELSKDSWLLAINREEGSSKYIVWLIYSKFTGTEELKIEDEQWILAHDGTDQEFAPDGYNYNKGEYDTFLEALKASQKINPAAENPFK